MPEGKNWLEEGSDEIASVLVVDSWLSTTAATQMRVVCYSSLHRSPSSCRACLLWMKQTGCLV